MLHASVRAIRWVVGGPDMVIQAILEVLGPEGTLMMYVGWEDDPFQLAEWPEEWQRAYLEECPPFDPQRSRANRKWCILTEYLRTWPGAPRSDHPEASVAAVGAKANWITANHPLHYSYGPGSPLCKLCEAEGKVLLLGAPLNTLTILHHAETLARVPNKRLVRYKMPVLRDGERVWVEIEDIDTSQGAFDWEGGNYFEAIAREYPASGKGRTGRVGAAESCLFDATELVEFAVKWLEERFGEESHGMG
ncbi:MAG: aminoglycoside 3-N-acetyltransferase [Candidatus Bipolaricaulaceae bacterium]